MPRSEWSVSERGGGTTAAGAGAPMAEAIPVIAEIVLACKPTSSAVGTPNSMSRSLPTAQAISTTVPNIS